MSEPIALSVKSAAGSLEVSESTIREAINKQELPAFRVGRAIRIDVADLRDWFKGRTRVGSDDDR